MFLLNILLAVVVTSILQFNEMKLSLFVFIKQMYMTERGRPPIILLQYSCLLCGAIDFLTEIFLLYYCKCLYGALILEGIAVCHFY